VSRLSGKPFEILAVSVDDERSELVRLLENKKPPGIHTWDAKGRENPVAELYNVYGLPTWYVIDGKGIIRHRDPDPDQLVTVIEATYSSGDVGPVKSVAPK